jgi:hypothetical protein
MTLVLCYAAVTAVGLLVALIAVAPLWAVPLLGGVLIFFLWVYVHQTHCKWREIVRNVKRHEQT